MIELKTQDILLRAEENSNSQKLEHVFEESRPALLAAIKCRVGSKMRRRVSPSDVLQEAYIAALKKLDQYVEDPTIPMFHWLKSICFQAISVIYQKNFVAQKRSLLLEQYQIDDQECNLFLDSETSPSKRMIRDEEQEFVMALVSRMGEADQMILYLRHVEDISNREAAERLGIELETAKKRHTRALQRLTQLAEEQLVTT